jgi:V/A-type H+-transporting ATPase subunit D
VRIRHPPGRAGRPWLAHRLAVARRGAELLDDKRRALLRERARLQPRVAEARERWERLASDAERWLIRAAVLGGERQMALSAASPAPPTPVVVRWHTVLGVTCPSGAEVQAPSVEALPPGASAALIEAARAHRDAVEAAAQVAVAQRALALVEADLRATALRRNAIRHRWIPAHEEALAALTATLEELEREDGARVRSIVQRQEGQAGSTSTGPA